MPTTPEEMRIKNEMIAQRKAGGCIRCGEKNPVVLQFHHRDRSSKTGIISSLRIRATIEGLRLELEKCDVLCANCHLIVERETNQQQGYGASITQFEQVPVVESKVARQYRSREECADVLAASLSRNRGKVIVRFSSFIRKDPVTSCWLWNGATTHGYPIFTLDGRPIRATHVACAIEKNSIPGRSSRMTCSNLLCVNPDHVLYLGKTIVLSAEFPYTLVNILRDKNE